MKTCRKNLHKYEDTLKQCPECRKIASAEYCKANVDRCKTNLAKWRKVNSDKEKATTAK